MCRTADAHDLPVISLQCCNMKIEPIVQLILLVTLLAGSSEEFFFEYPKKALTEFFQSLKAKKQPPKAMNNIEHYHVHYYPMPIPLLAWTKAPDKRYMEKIYDDVVRSFGWSDYFYKYTPEPSVILPSRLQQLWDEPWNEEILLEPETASIDRITKGILVQVPVNQQLTLHLLKKLRQKQMAT